MKMQRIIHYPLYKIKSNTWKKEKKFELEEILSKDKLKQICLDLPTDLEVAKVFILKDFLSGYFDEAILKDANKNSKILECLGQFTKDKNPAIALKFIDNAIQSSIDMYSKYYPGLLNMYLTQSKIKESLGDIDGMYECINKAFLIASFNFNNFSIEMLTVFEEYRSFSFKIEEEKEHLVYSAKMEDILNSLSLKEDKLKIIYFKLKLLNCLTSFPDQTYTVDDLKTYFKKFSEIQAEIPVDLITNNTEESIFIQFCLIRLEYFFKKETRFKCIPKINSLIWTIKKEYGEKSKYLMEPYLFIMKYYKDKEQIDKLESFLLDEWCELVELLTHESLLLSANLTLDLVKSLITTDKLLKLRLSNLLNYAGDNYSSVFESKEKKWKEGFLFAEMCYYGAYINRDEAIMQPWSLAASSVEIYKSILGHDSDKYKKAMNLYRIIEGKHNVQRVN